MNNLLLASIILMLLVGALTALYLTDKIVTTIIKKLSKLKDPMTQFPNLNDDTAQQLLTILWRTTLTILVILAIIKGCTPEPIETP